jgi:hypothetical protein
LAEIRLSCLEAMLSAEEPLNVAGSSSVHLHLNDREETNLIPCRADTVLCDRLDLMEARISDGLESEPRTRV